jgi:hypothetical protein
MSLLTACGLSAGKVKALVPLIKKKYDADFIVTTMSSIDRACRRGCVLDIGTAKSPSRGCDDTEFSSGGSFFVVPHMKRNHLDNEQANKSATISYSASKGERNCRTCDCLSCNFYPRFSRTGKMTPSREEKSSTEPSRFRSSVFTELISGLSQDYLMGRASAMKGAAYSREEKIIAQLRKQYSIAPFRNPMCTMYRFWERFGMGTLHVMTIIDRLHTVILGLLAYCFRWSMAITFGCKGSRRKRVPGGGPQEEEDPIAEMDKRAKALSTRQAFNPCASDTHRPMAILKQGFSFGFKDTTDQTEALKHGIISGGNIDGSMMVDLLFGFLLSLGNYGRVVPNCILSFHTTRNNLSTKAAGVILPPLFKTNPTTAIMEAGWAAMELNLMLGGDYYTEADLASLERLIQVVIEKTTYLYYVKQTLVRSPGK